jgi:hypothetical protein
MVQLKNLANCVASAFGNTVHKMFSSSANLTVAIFGVNEFGGGFGNFCMDPTLDSLLVVKQ